MCYLKAIQLKADFHAARENLLMLSSKLKMFGPQMSRTMGSLADHEVCANVLEYQLIPRCPSRE